MSNLVGKKFKNYIELCAAMQELPTTGASKIAQRARFEKKYELEKTGKAFTVIALREIPTAPVKTSVAFVSELRDIEVRRLLMLLALEDSGRVGAEVQTVYTPREQLLKILCLVNENFKISEQDFERFPDLQRLNFVTMLRSYPTVVRALDGLQKDGVLAWAEGYEVLLESGESFFSSDNSIG